MMIFMLVFFMILFVFSLDLFFVQFYFMLIFFLFLILDLNFFFGSISYFFGVDFISYGLILLTLIIFNLMFLSSLNFRFFYLCGLFFLNLSILFFCLFIVFYVLNFFLMYLFFELSLVPLIVLIFGWGYQPERLISGIYLFFYTLFASFPLFFNIIYIYVYSFSLFFDSLFFAIDSLFLYFSMILAFLVKLPLYMFHFWLPKAHVQAPISGSMVLAGVLLKVGGYGFFRFSLMFESLFYSYSFILYSVCIFGSLIVGLMCFIQFDLKCMIAYSSVVHMGMCLIGLLSMTTYGLIGSYFMMLSHGLCSSGLFFLCNVNYIRIFSRSFFLNSGMIFFMPSIVLFWLIFCCFNIGCPPSLNFFSELFISVSCLFYFDLSCFILFILMVFSACYGFFMFGFSQHGIYSSFYSFSMVNVCEYLVVFVHLIPLFMMSFCLEFLFY